MSREPRALHSVAHGGTRPSTQSVPAESVWTTRTLRSPGSASSAARSSLRGTTNAASCSASGSCRISTPAGAAARIAAYAGSCTEAITAARLVAAGAGCGIAPPPTPA
jgi:hypothetical protein